MNRALLILTVLAIAACDGMPGKPKSKWQPPSAVSDFATLYSQNCLGCHGIGGVASGSIAMDNPTYLSVLPIEALRTAIAQGIPGTAMPSFSIPAGGTLTDDQIAALANGILAKKPSKPNPSLPPYSASLGNPASGAAVFAASCASCHDADGTAGAVTNPAYLNLVTNQYLRSIVIAGRQDLGCPDYASRIPGRTMTNEEIANVTAWLASNRKNEFGQPLIPATPSQP